MNSSARATATFTRCVVTLDAGIRLPETPGDEHPFHQRLERARPAIEVLFDELEQARYRFTAPVEPGFAPPQRGAHGAIEMFEVQVKCSPALSEPELAQLAESVGRLVRP